mgnify:CR=1 FL=1
MRIISDMISFFRLPEAVIDLMKAETEGNDPFYAELVENYYKEANTPHPRYKLFGAMRYGVALCQLPRSFEDYLKIVEASGRRNVKKAERLGYLFSRINFNDYLIDIGEIRRSAQWRQGKMPDEIINSPVMPIQNPPSRTNIHDYVYFGVLKEKKLVAYAGLFVAGEMAMIEHILGHAEYQQDGIVPLLIIGMANEIFKSYPKVKYYCYGTWFGASVTMRRFKKKFGFRPYKVKWEL